MFPPAAVHAAASLPSLQSALQRHLFTVFPGPGQKFLLLSGVSDGQLVTGVGVKNIVGVGLMLGLGVGVRVGPKVGVAALVGRTEGVGVANAPGVHEHRTPLSHPHAPPTPVQDDALVLL